MPVRGIDRESEHSVKLISHSRKIACRAFSISHKYSVLRDTSDKKTLSCWVISDSFRNQSRIFQSKSDRRIRRLHIFICQFVANCLEFFVIPNRIKASLAHGDEPELAPLQTAEQLQRELILTELTLERSLVKHQQTVVGSFLAQRLNPHQR